MSQPSYRTLEEIVGRDAVTDPSEWCRACAWEGALPKAIVFPTTSEQICEILKLASRERLRLAPAGSGTRQRMGGVPSDIDVILSLARMNRVMEYPRNDLTITVQAGISLSALQVAVDAQGQMLPLDMPFQDRSTVGGSMATNASGPQRLAYGTWRDFVLGVQFVTADGKLAKGGGKVVKNVAGYDLPKLLIGSFGTLGVITEVSLKVFPKPSSTATFATGFADSHSALQANHRILNSPLAPHAMDSVDSNAGMMIGESELLSPYNLVVRAAGPDVVLERFRQDLPALMQDQGGKPSRIEGAREIALWKSIQEMTPVFLAAKPDGCILKASLPLTAMQTFIASAKLAAASRNFSSAFLARAGSGIVYCYLQPLENQGDDSKLIAVGQEILRCAEQLGGRAIIEWCPTEMKRKINLWGTLRDDFPLMKHLKAEFDPLGILNPGRLYGGI